MKHRSQPHNQLCLIRIGNKIFQLVAVFSPVREGGGASGLLPRSNRLGPVCCPGLLFIGILHDAAVRLDVKTDHAIMLAGLGNIVVKGILRITRGIGRSYAQKYCPAGSVSIVSSGRIRFSCRKNTVLNR